MKYLVGTFIILFGMFMVIKSEWILNFFGYSEWAEAKFSIWGGSRTMYKLIGLVLIIGALLLMTGWLQDIVLAIFRPVGNL